MAAVVALNIMTWSMRDKVGDLATAVVTAQASQKYTDSKVDALEVRVQRLEVGHQNYREAFAATVAKWTESMRQWEARMSTAITRGRR
jgi:hypothetical protein